MTVVPVMRKSACSWGMAICLDCKREMTTAASCTVTTLHIDEVPFPMARHRRSGAGRCGDCGVEPGGYHHLGCDLARCPRCGRQLISCGCPFDELDGESYDDYDDYDEEDDEEGNYCPACGSDAVIPILYGRPGNPAIKALQSRGVLELGDPAARDHPTSRCKDCEHGWTLFPA
jgi:hypothetical protein